MARQRSTMEHAEAVGDLDHNKKRYAGRKQAPQPAGPLGDPPAFFDDIQRDVWREVEALPAPGVLTSADRLLVETLVYLIQLQRSAGGISAVDRGHLRACLGSMGCTPADRTKVSSATPKTPNAQPQTPIALLRSRASGRVN